MNDPYLLSVLAVVAYMGIGALLGAVAHHVRPVTSAFLFVTLAVAGVVANSWRWLAGFTGFWGVSEWLAEGAYWYSGAALALLGGPFALVFLVLHAARRRHITEPR